ncbi:MAG: hypothetical protein ACI8YI_002359, partial [Paracoccaceae bacterium]
SSLRGRIWGTCDCSFGVKLRFDRCLAASKFLTDYADVFVYD